MTKDTFLKTLEAELKGLDREEREEILAEYREHFAMALADGRDEAGIALSLGNPKALAKEIRATTLIEQVQHEVSFTKLFHAIFVAAGLGLVNLLILAGPFFGLLGGLAGLYAAAGALILSPLVALYMNGVPTSGADWLQLVFALVMTVVGWYMGRGLIWLTKWMYRWFVKYLAYNVKLVKGKGIYEA
ncbi:DUF1700 domain-containing protein [Tumebacillus sp. ITR2]|uniref:DUF1700 domain-containing protein n=1 Tax=Tumebacillus amylolyticus TaxID=2801339 RepID=A0ABS1JA11_9BACL|nr:DUF1700 domain-containing protein [Tumebacillus amylolyticus]MBL0387089.1 DUF1700 domain-containing protein [Tumebacillus amylolyticus]